MRYAVETDLKLLVRNYFEARWLVPILGSLIALSVAVAGFYAPKKYESYSTLLVEGQTIITPLMQGAAVTGQTSDWGKVAEEVVFSRRTMTRLMKSLGLVEDQITTREDDALLDKFKRNTKVTLNNGSYLKIQFRDTDPYFAKDVATQLTNLFIDETHGYRVDESEDAFEFIDTQVKQYEKKLLSAEERLAEFKIDEQQRGLSSESVVTGRLDQLQKMLDTARLELSEAEIKQASLEAQLSSEISESVSLGRQSQYIDRLAALEDQLAILRLTYHETYPDIVSLTSEIGDLRNKIRREKQSNSSGDEIIDQSYKSNKVYQGIKIDLSTARTEVASLTARITYAEEAILEEKAKGEAVLGSEATLAALSRDYKVNKELYEDLLKRRESARVSKEIDESQSGLNIKVYEPAFLPLQPAGFRFVHFLLGGLVLGFLVPIAAVYALQLTDRNLKSPEGISEKLGDIPVLGFTSNIQNKADVRKERQSKIGGKVLYMLTFMLLAAISYLKYMQAAG